MTVKEIFDHISSDNGSNAKMDILRSYSENETLKRALYLANSPRVKFYIKHMGEYPKNSGSPTLTLNEAMDLLSPLSSREKTGHDALNHLHTVLSSLSPDDAYIIERIIDRDCKIGMGVTNINKIFPGLIEETPYMGAKAFSKKLVDELLAQGNGAYSQIKMDGRYANVIIEGGIVNMESRGGEPSYLEGATFVEELKRFPDCVLNGELTMDGYNRYESNGIIASLITINAKIIEGKKVTKELAEFEKEHGMSMKEALGKIRYTTWDTITLDEYTRAHSDTPYSQRLDNIAKYISDAQTTMVSLIETTHVNSYAEAMKLFQQTINLGYEGNILKSIDGVWKDGKPKWQIKLKLEITIDLRITGFRYGTGKNEHLISSVEAVSEDGLLFTAPTGIKEKEMKYITENQESLKGAILETKCSGVSQDSEGNYSLLHPVYKEIRTDKTTADTLQHILDIEAMAKGLK